MKLKILINLNFKQVEFFKNKKTVFSDELFLLLYNENLV